MKSKIMMSEQVINKNRKFGSQKEYFPCEIVYEDGKVVAALFTKDQILNATERAARNPEDIPEDKTFWESLF